MRFRNGKTSVFDDEKPIWPTSSFTVGNAALEKELLDNDRPLTVLGITEEIYLLYYIEQYIHICEY